MLKDEAGSVDFVGVFWSGARESDKNLFTRGSSFPLCLLEKGDEVANLVDSSLTEKTDRAPAVIASKHRIEPRKYLGVLVLAFPHLKPTSTAWSGRGGDEHIRVKRRRAVAASYIVARRVPGGGARTAQAPVPWLMGAAFGARTPIAEFMPRLKETAVETRFPSLNSDHDRGERRWKRAFSTSKNKKKE